LKLINSCNIYKTYQLTHLGPTAHPINHTDKRFRVSQFKTWLLQGNFPWRLLGSLPHRMSAFAWRLFTHFLGQVQLQALIIRTWHSLVRHSSSNELKLQSVGWDQSGWDDLFWQMPLLSAWVGQVICVLSAIDGIFYVLLLLKSLIKAF